MSSRICVDVLVLAPVNGTELPGDELFDVVVVVESESHVLGA